MLTASDNEAMEAPIMNRIEINVVAFREEGTWVAQGLEYDITVHAAEITQLPAVFERAVLRNVCVNAELGRVGLEGVPAAPSRFRELFDQALMDLKARTAKRAPRAPVKIRGFRVAEIAA